MDGDVYINYIKHRKLGSSSEKIVLPIQEYCFNVYFTQEHSYFCRIHDFLVCLSIDTGRVAS